MLGNPMVSSESFVSHGYTATSDAKAKQYSRPRSRQGSLQGLKEASGFSSSVFKISRFTGENDKAPDRDDTTNQSSNSQHRYSFSTLIVCIYSKIGSTTA